MNILGHCLISLRVFGGFGGVGAINSMSGIDGVKGVGERRRDDLIVGTLLPESCPFIADNPFSFDEIHEGGEVLLSFLKERYLDRVGLALGMLAHSVKFGADSFNKEVEGYIDRGDRGDRGREQLLRKITEAFNIDIIDAPKRVHNILWAGVDFWLLEKESWLITRIKKAINTVDITDNADILAECFNKDRDRAREVVEELFKKIYRVEDLDSQEGLVRIGIRHAAGLPEKDRIDFEKALVLVRECQGIMRESWEKLVKEVETSVVKRMSGLTI